jgi:ribosomal protein S18 acetylase RimI-like enzyme
MNGSKSHKLKNMETALDNPAWWALDSYHASFAVGGDLAKRYQPGILPFAACHPASQDSVAALDPLIKGGESFYLIGELPTPPAGWVIEVELPCAQMIGPAAITAPEDVPISLLGEADKEEMYDLITGVQPGYYNRDTLRLGTYYGIRMNGRLVAMAGERLRLKRYTELSAICTHTEYRGQQYAQRLIARLCRMHYTSGIIPFLHVATSNERAIRLYEYMGFTHRRQISFWRIRKIEDKSPALPSSAGYR